MEIGKADFSAYNYQSPIQMITDDIAKDIVQKQDGWLVESVRRVGFNIDKDELAKALNYDREQYEKGYADGRRARESEIVRCKDCKHRPTDPKGHGYGQDLEFPDDVCPCQVGDNWYSWMPDDNWFCASGERKEVEDESERT